MLDTVSPNSVPNTSQETDGERLTDLAQRLAEAIEAQLAADPGDLQAVARLVVAVFGPAATQDSRQGIGALIEDEPELSRIVGAVLDCVRARQTSEVGPQ